MSVAQERWLGHAGSDWVPMSLHAMEVAARLGRTMAERQVLQVVLALWQHQFVNPDKRHRVGTPTDEVSVPSRRVRDLTGMTSSSDVSRVIAALVERGVLEHVERKGYRGARVVSVGPILRELPEDRRSRDEPVTSGEAARKRRVPSGEAARNAKRAVRPLATKSRVSGEAARNSQERAVRPLATSAIPSGEAARSLEESSAPPFGRSRAELSEDRNEDQHDGDSTDVGRGRLLLRLRGLALTGRNGLKGERERARRAAELADAADRGEPEDQWLEKAVRLIDGVPAVAVSR